MAANSTQFEPTALTPQRLGSQPESERVKNYV